MLVNGQTPHLLLLPLRKPKLAMLVLMVVLCARMLLVAWSVLTSLLCVLLVRCLILLLLVCAKIVQ